MIIRTIGAIALIATGSSALAASAATSFAFRVPAGAKLATPIVHELSADPVAEPRAASGFAAGSSLASVARFAAQWGRVTSLRRSPEHNRAVGGVPNSFHLSGRAIDIARRAGVSHWQIVAAYRAAGYRLVESLDEGDHTHLAFDFGRYAAPRALASAEHSVPGEVTSWRMVYAPGVARR